MTQDNQLITINGKKLTVEAALAALQIISTAKSRRKDGPAAQGPRAPTIFRYASNGPTSAERTRWPRIGGIVDNCIVATDFTIVNHGAPFSTEDVVYAYIAGAPFLRDRAKAYHMPLMKVGLSMLPNLLSRQDDLRADQYGAFRKNNDGSYIEDKGSDWEMQRSMLQFTPHENSPISLIDRGLRIRLPLGYEFLQFEKDFQNELRSCAFHAFAKSPEGRAHFAKLELDPTNIIPMCRYGFGAQERWGIASEIYIGRPRTDFSRIGIVAERLVAAFITQSSKG